MYTQFPPDPITLIHLQKLNTKNKVAGCGLLFLTGLTGRILSWRTSTNARVTPSKVAAKARPNCWVGAQQIDATVVCGGWCHSMWCGCGGQVLLVCCLAGLQSLLSKYNPQVRVTPWCVNTSNLQERVRTSPSPAVMYKLTVQTCP
jgi:hypothetical protein